MLYKWLCNWQEALVLSSLKSRLDEANIQLYGVVRQEYGVKGFQPWFNGPIFFDPQVKLFIYFIYFVFKHLGAYLKLHSL